MKKPKSYPLENEDKLKETNKRLRAQLRRERRRIKNLESEVKTLEGALRKTEEFLKDNLQGFSLQECIEAAKHKKTLKTMQKEKACPLCSDHVTIIKIRNADVLICSNHDCDFREKNETNE